MKELFRDVSEGELKIEILKLGMEILDKVCDATQRATNEDTLKQLLTELESFEKIKEILSSGGY